MSSLFSSWFSSSNSPITTTSINTTGTGIINIIPSPLVPSGSYVIGNPNGVFTTSSSNCTLSPSSVNVKKCRFCNHAHLEDQQVCVDSSGWSLSIVMCHCKEYAPKDNLEFLEWKYNKDQQKESK
jgi:hypothetical protein